MFAIFFEKKIFFLQNVSFVDTSQEYLLKIN